MKSRCPKYQRSILMNISRYSELKGKGVMSFPFFINVHIFQTASLYFKLMKFLTMD